MKFDFGLRAKFDSKCLIHSKSSVYQILGHEKFEKKSIPLDPVKLTFTIKALNLNYLEKLFKSSDSKPTNELSKYVQYYTLYTILSFSILILFESIAYKSDSMPSMIFIIHLIHGISFITCSILLLYLVHRHSALMIHNRTFFTILIYVKIVYYAFFNNKTICYIAELSDECSRLPLTLMIVIEFTMARVVLFYAYMEVAILAIGTFIVLLITKVFIVAPDYSGINETVVVSLYCLILTADCYTRDFRMKQIFWRGLQEDQATNHYKLSHPLSPIGPDFDLVSICEELKKNLKYFSKVIIYKDARTQAKNSLKEIMKIKETLIHMPNISDQIEIPTNLDEQDYSYLLENCFNQLNQQIPNPFALRTSTLLHAVPSFVPNLQSSLTSIGKNWNYDVFILKDSINQPISLISDFLLKKWGILPDLSISESSSKQFFSSLEKSYIENDFTNALHAVDVMHCFLCLLLDSKIRESLSSYELLSVIIAGLGHDAGHPGLSSRFLVLTKNAVARKYNDKSVLENLHCSIIFNILNETESNMFENFPLAYRNKCRRIIIELILATDFNRHFEVVGKFRSRAVLMQDLNMEVDDDRTIALVLALKCADVGFSAKNLPLHKKWMGLWQEEMFKQGDMEKEFGMSVSMYCDRKNEKTQKLAYSFLNNITIPMLNIYAQWLDTRICKETVLSQAEKNLEYWEKQVKLEETQKFPKQE